MNVDDDYEPLDSPLSQHVSRDGHTISIEIYGTRNGRWILEIVDEFDNSTVWDDPFETDQAALAEAIRTIEEEGIETLVGAPPSSTH